MFTFCIKQKEKKYFPGPKEYLKNNKRNGNNCQLYFNNLFI